jgi:hypothetical protein
LEGPAVAFHWHGIPKLKVQLGFPSNIIRFQQMKVQLRVQLAGVAKLKCKSGSQQLEVQLPKLKVQPFYGKMPALTG